MNIDILSFRIAGNDGVSLECKHWRNILSNMGHKVQLVAGELDEKGIVIPEMHFLWPRARNLYDRVVRGEVDYPQVSKEISASARVVEDSIRNSLKGKRVGDLWIVANCFSIPMHFSLAIALKRVIEDLGIPTIVRNHDFWWERDRFIKPSFLQFFQQWFPPTLLVRSKHVVINSIAQYELKKRTGIDSVVIADSFDFSKYNKYRLSETNNSSARFRRDFGLSKDDIIFLQATRIVPRKRLELSIEFIRELADPKAVFVSAGVSGDEGREYEDRVKRIAKKSGIRYMFIGDELVAGDKKASKNAYPRRRSYTLWDCYTNCDFILYPTELEGFGNQFIEAVYFQKPIIMTEYPVFKKDIAPLGFKVFLMNEKSLAKSAMNIRKFIHNSSYIKDITRTNFAIAKKHFSYEATAKKIKKLINGIFV
jgi:glycosyltransferase involved in cell wall biosynthesis